MRLYMDDDCTSRLLVIALTKAGHDVQIPRDIGLGGKDDAIHLLHAIRENRVLFTGNHRDFQNLHNLVIGSQGGHPGIWIARKDDDRRRDISPAQVVRAISNLLTSGVQFTSDVIVLNHWR